MSLAYRLSHPPARRNLGITQGAAILNLAELTPLLFTNGIS